MKLRRLFGLDRPRGWGAGKKAGTFSRRRGLAEFERLFPPGLVEETLRDATGDPVRVVEIGCGEGKLLLDLLKRFPRLEAHGINLRPWPAMTGRDSFRDAALRYGVFTRDQLESIELPHAWFHDAEELRFDDASVDLVVSQVAIPYVRRKDRLLEETWRVLRPGGRALLHLDTRAPAAPDFLRVPTPRFVVYRDGARVDVETLLAERRDAGLDVRYEETAPEEKHGRVRALVRFEKNVDLPLALGLTLDESSSIPLHPLKPKSGPNPTFFGHRSVFVESGDRAR